MILTQESTYVITSKNGDFDLIDDIGQICKREANVNYLLALVSFIVVLLFEF